MTRILASGPSQCPDILFCCTLHPRPPLRPAALTPEWECLWILTLTLHWGPSSSSWSSQIPSSHLLPRLGTLQIQGLAGCSSCLGFQRLPKCLRVIFLTPHIPVTARATSVLDDQVQRPLAPESPAEALPWQPAQPACPQSRPRNSLGSQGNHPRVLLVFTFKVPWKPPRDDRAVSLSALSSPWGWCRLRDGPQREGR